MTRRDVGGNPGFDAAIVGASISGCAAAIFLARKGARVALIERNADPNAYKKLCTHYIQPSATPTLQRLGLAAPIEAAGGVCSELNVWTRWGWIKPPPTPRKARPSHGYSIRREKLDPMLRELAAATAGVELMPGLSVRELLFHAGRISGVAVEGAGHHRREIAATLVVGADGRNTRVAELAGLRLRTKPNGRFGYFAYYRDLPLKSGSHAQLWFLEPDIAYAMPGDDGLTLVAAMPARAKLPEWKADVEQNMLDLFERLPDGPTLKAARRVSPFLGMVEAPEKLHKVARPGLALIGDAALAADPLWGVGCGWALQSAEWLAEAVGGAFAEPVQLDQTLENYRRRHRRELALHEFLIGDYASGRAFNPLEKLMYSAAARDAVCADGLVAFGARCIGVAEFLSPAAMARSAWVNMRHLAKEKLARRPAQPAKAA